MASKIVILDDDRRQIFDYENGTNVIYIGKAHPLSLVSESKWQIRKFTYDANNSVTNIEFASGTNLYDKVWNNRTTYDYTPDS